MSLIKKHTHFSFLTTVIIKIWIIKFSCGKSLDVDQKCRLNSVRDLTWTVNEENVNWPGAAPFNFTKVVASYDEGFWYAENEFMINEHVGTHIDAPYHLDRNGWKVADIPLNRLLAKGVLLDMSKEVEKNGPDTLVTVQHLNRWEKENGQFPKESILFVKFGWSKFYSNRTLFLGFDDNGKMNYPGISKEAAQKIVDSKKFFGVGVDTESVDPTSVPGIWAHRIFQRNSLYLLESVKMVECLPPKGFSVIVAPMKIEKGSGAPTRIFAIPSNKISLNNL